MWYEMYIHHAYRTVSTSLWPHFLLIQNEQNRGQTKLVVPSIFALIKAWLTGKLDLLIRVHGPS